jgi:hypothetical protein
MAGMIDEARNAPASVSGKKGSLTVTADGVRAKMPLKGQQLEEYDRLVLAGKKIMYSEQLKPQMLALLKGPGTDGEKIGKGVVGVVGLLYTHLNGTMPPQMIIPVATELVADVADFLSKAGMQISDDDVAEGMATMIEEILGRAGISPEQIPELLQQQQQGGQQAGAAPATPMEESPEGAPDAGVDAGMGGEV